MKYSYKAKKEDGTEYEGKKEAKDKFALYRDIRAEGGTVLSVKEIGPGVLANMKFDPNHIRLRFLERVKLQDKILFAKNLAAMLSAGLPMERALNVMERQAKADVLKELFQSIIGFIAEGKQLSEGMVANKKVFSPLFISMVRAGEESGRLSESLLIVAKQLEYSYELRRKVRGALMYPSIVVFAMGIIGILMLTYVVPTLAATFRELKMELPMSTKMILFVSDILVNYLLLALGVLVAIVVGLVYANRTPPGKRVFHMIFLRIPIIGFLVKEVNAARTTRTLSSLLESGVDIGTAFQITGDTIQNVYFKDVVEKARESVTKGNTMSSVFREAEHLYPPLVNEMMAVGEETGNLPKMLQQVAVFYEGSVDEKTKNMSTIVEPFLMLVVGGAVGFFAFAMIQPIYGLSSAL